MSDQINFDTMSYTLQDNGIALIAMDVKDRSMNVLTPEMHVDFGLVAEHLANDEKAIGAVIHSAKPSFMAGGDLNRIVRNYDLNRTPQEAYEQSRTYTNSLRKLETCGKPIAVAINGTALGGGLELALACHYRVVLDNPKLLLGLPEVTLGLLPGGGGTQRLPRIIGLKNAADLILSGRHIHPEEALQLGVIDEIASADNLMTAAEKWILDGGSAVQPWDVRGYKVPGGSGLNQMPIAQLFQKLTLKVAVDYKYNYPAPIAALRCLFNGTTVLSMDTALKVETKEFSALTRDPVARNMIRTLFINKSNIDSAARKGAAALPPIKTVGLKGDLAYKEILETACLKSGLTLVTDSVDGNVDILIIAGDDQTATGESDIAASKKIGLYLTAPIDKSKAAELIKYSETSDDTLAHMKALSSAMRKTPLVQKTEAVPLSQQMKTDYNTEANRLMNLGISSVIIRNTAIAAGMHDAPDLLADNDANKEDVKSPLLSVDGIKICLLLAQTYPAILALKNGDIDPVDADLISVLINRFPSYTGGVISHIDTLGLSNAIDTSSNYHNNDGAINNVIVYLEALKKSGDRIYPSLA